MERVLPSLMRRAKPGWRRARRGDCSIGHAQEQEEALIGIRRSACTPSPRPRLELVAARRPRQEQRQQPHRWSDTGGQSLKSGRSKRLASDAVTTDLTPNGACVRLAVEEDVVGF